MNRKIYLILIPIIIVLILAATIIYREKSQEKLKITNTNKTEFITDSTNQADKTQKTLSILPNRCQGCGRCAMVDPKHFQIEGRAAVVISQTDLNSEDLMAAINNCHERAIQLK